MPNCFPINKTQSAENVGLDESARSIDDPKRVLIVMDALKDFLLELFECVLKNFTFDTSSRINILGIAPYLNIPRSAGDQNRDGASIAIASDQQFTRYPRGIRPHDKKHIDYTKKIPCNMVMENDNGKVYLIKKVKCDFSSEVDNDTADVESSSSFTTTHSEKEKKKIIKHLNPKTRPHQNNKVSIN